MFLSKSNWNEVFGYGAVVHAKIKGKMVNKL